MSYVRFKMTPGAERELQRQVKPEVERRSQQLLDRLRLRYRGADRSEIRAALTKAGVAGQHGKPSDELVEAIHRGDIIKLDMSHWR